MNLPSTPTDQPEQRLTTGLGKKTHTHPHTKIHTIYSTLFDKQSKSVHDVFVIRVNIPDSHTLACVSDFRRCVFDMFSFLASKHRQPPEYRPHEDDGDEGQLRTAR